MKVGFIGLGIMGRPMAKNLLKAGYSLFVNNRTQSKVRELVACGAKEASYREMAEECEVILTMLPNSPQVKEVMLADGGMASYLGNGHTFIDMSSISPSASQEIAHVLAEKGVEMLDAPVSGGEPKAIDGTLSFMVGGKQEVFEKYKGLLSTMGSSVVLCGAVGAGNATKLANQIIVACNIAALSEGLMLARRAGVDPNTVFEAIRGGLAGSTVMNAKAPMMLSNNTRPGFKIDLHIKDLANALETGHNIGSPLPLTASVMEMLQQVRADGFGQCDHSALAKYYEKLCGSALY